jgi:hypothetical protein
MAKFSLEFGREIEIPTLGEMAVLLAQRDAQQRAQWAGKKYWRLPPLTGYAVSSALDIGGDTIAARAGTLGPAWNGRPSGPAAGYVWELKRIAVAGLTASATTPDVVNLIRHGSGVASGSALVWQFNGNNWAYTFGNGELIIRAGETLRLKSVGTFAAAGLITLSGEGFEYTAERFAAQDR